MTSPSVAIYYKVGTPTTRWGRSRLDRGRRLAAAEVAVAASAGATEAFVRLFNAAPIGQTAQAMYFDDLSVRELVGDMTLESITPARDGVNTLSVQALDGAGNRFRPEDLPVPGASERRAEPGTGPWTRVRHVGAFGPGEQPPAVFGGSGAAWLSPGRVGASAVTMAGAGRLSTASPVLDTSHAAGFSVAAWVRLTDLSGGARPCPRTAQPCRCSGSGSVPTGTSTATVWPTRPGASR